MACPVRSAAGLRDWAPCPPHPKAPTASPSTAPSPSPGRRPRHPRTRLARRSSSALPGGPFYLDSDGVPFVITVDEAGFWPLESARIDDAFPDVRAHFQSGGGDHTDWYQNPDYDFVYLPEPAAPWLLACGAAPVAALARRRRDWRRGWDSNPRGLAP